MAATILAFLFAIQACIGMPMNDECCGSKMVGDYAYTLVETTVSFPNECLNSCAYSRDGQPGSLYCFAHGNLAVTCYGDEQYCFPGPPGPTGCPPENNLKITSYPNTIGTRPSLTDCSDFCRALCPVIDNSCACNAWTYSTVDETCLTFDSPFLCYNTTKEDGWVSGAPCHESNTAPIKEEETIPGTSEQQTITYGPYGNLPGNLYGFDDRQQNVNISEITIVTGMNSEINAELITGIKFTYRGSPSQNFHGQQFTNQTGQKTITCTVQEGTYFNKITVRSFEKQTSNPKTNLVYYLHFESTDSGMKPATCAAGNEELGVEHIIPTNDKGGKILNHVAGHTDGSGKEAVIADLSFVFLP